MNHEEVFKLNSFRRKYHEKLQTLLDDIMMASLEQNNILHESLQEDLDTTLLILWRYDRKLREARANIAR